jgi:predicted nucleic acid-binding protein
MTVHLDTSALIDALSGRAACALSDKAALWTLNPADFSDIPGLTLIE